MKDMKVEKCDGSLIHKLYRMARLAPGFLLLLLLVMVLPQSQAGAASGEVDGQERRTIIIRNVPGHDIAVSARQWVDKIIQRVDQDDSPATREKIAEAILKVGRGAAIPYVDSSNGLALVFYDEIDRRFRSDKHPVIQRMVAEMLVLKGICMRGSRFWASIEQHRLDRRESVAIFEEFEGRFGQNDDPIIRALSAKALVEKGIAWLEIDNPSAAIAAYDEAVSRFGEDEFPAVRAQVAYALLQKALALKDPSFLDVFNELDRRYGQDEDPEVRERVIEMLFKKARITGWPGGKEEDDRWAIATFDEINQRFGKGNTTLQLRIIEELTNTSSVARRTPYYEQVLQWFGDDDKLQGPVTWALIRWGANLHGNDAIAVYDEDIRRAEKNLLAADASEGKESLLVDALDRKAHALQELGESEAALAIYDDIERRFGQDDRQMAALFLVRKGHFLEKRAIS